MNRSIIAAAGVCLAVISVSGQSGSSQHPDVIFYNGRIATVDASSRVVQAFAIAQDRFVAVGSDAEMKALAGPDTRLVDLTGHAVVPGLIDNHNHQYHVALLALRGVDVSGVSSLAELLARLRRAATTTPAGQTIYSTTGWDPDEFAEKRGPSRAELDEVSASHPVVVYESRGRVFVNSAALKALRIARNLPDPELATVGRAEGGEPTGLISGSPAGVLNLMATIVPQPDLDEKKELIAKMQVEQHAMGLTGIRELQLHPDVMQAYFELWRERRLTMRTSVGLELNAGEEEHLEEELGQWGVGSGFGDEWLRLDGIAEFNPGDMFREPVLDAPAGGLGTPRLSEESFREAIHVMNRHGWRPAIHVSGDKTLDFVLDAYEAADQERPIKDRRWIVEHIPMVHADQIARMKRLGVAVSAQFQPYQGGAGMIRRWGRARAERALPLRALLDAGLVVGGGSDWPGAPNNPFVNIYYYVTRQTRDAGPLGIDQKITRQEALRVETLNNAYLTFDETLKGSIEPGKLADFVVLSADVLTVPEEEILSIHPLATYVGGGRVYSRPGGGY